jgi:hypothetical protein
VGQSLSARHCTHPGVTIAPQSMGLAPPSPPLAPPEEPLDVPVEPSPEPLLDVPLELPPDELLAVPLEDPLEEPLSEEPLDDPEPPPSGLFSEVLPPHPIPTATESAMARPRHLFNEDMAGLLSKLPEGSRCAHGLPRQRASKDGRSDFPSLGHDAFVPSNPSGNCLQIDSRSAPPARILVT